MLAVVPAQFSSTYDGLLFRKGSKFMRLFLRAGSVALADTLFSLLASVAANVPSVVCPTRVAIGNTAIDAARDDLYLDDAYSYVTSTATFFSLSYFRKRHVARALSRKALSFVNERFRKSGIKLSLEEKAVEVKRIATVPLIPVGTAVYF